MGWARAASRGWLPTAAMAARGGRLLATAIAGLLLAGCASGKPEVPASAFQPKQEVLELRRLQTRRFDTDEKTLLKASTGVLQDLGFIIDEINPEAGLISCSRKRDAKKLEQIAGYFALNLMLLYTGNFPGFAWDVEQVIRVSVATNPLPPPGGGAPKAATTVRITFQRLILNYAGGVNLRECINDPKIYQVFFEKLSRSVFLEAQEL